MIKLHKTKPLQNLNHWPQQQQQSSSSGGGGGSSSSSNNNYNMATSPSGR